jgi:(p)ppGpp synthase/HD superfamily hydrolase
MNPTALTPAHLGEAYAIAAEVHKDKVGKDERPYFEHVYEVARRAGKQYDRLQWNAPWQRLQVQIEAVLHDAIEDFKGTTVEKAMLRERIRITFGEWCGWALDRLTHRRGEPYEDCEGRHGRDR